MVEFAILALLNRMVSWGRAPVIATRIIAADADTLRALVSDPASQWRIVHGMSALLRPHAHVGTSRLPRLVPVRVRFGRRDVLRITWILTPSPGTTEVDLVAQIESHGISARLVLLAGGRRWLRHRLEALLADLAALAHCAAEDLHDVARNADFTQNTPRKGATA